MREMDANNFYLGRYLMYSFNDVKKYPKKPFFHKDISTTMTDEQMEKVAFRNNRILKGKIKTNDN